MNTLVNTLSKPIRRCGVLLLPLSLMLILLTSCKNGTSVDPFENSDDVGNYLQELPSWNQFSPPGQVRPPTPAGEAQIEDDVVLECGSH